MECLERLFSVEELLDGGRAQPRGRLTSAEEERFRSFGDPRAARLWLAGRLAAKTVLSELLAFPCAWNELHLESRNGLDRKVRPRVYLRGRLQPWSLSLAHVEEHVFAAVAEDENIRLGVDAIARDAVTPRTAAFWFTSGEIDWCRNAFPPLAYAVVWMLKEACYKAENRGEPFLPQQLDVRPRLPSPALFRELPPANRWPRSWTWEHDGRRYAVRAHERVLTALCAVRSVRLAGKRRFPACAVESSEMKSSKWLALKN